MNIFLPALITQKSFSSSPSPRKISSFLFSIILLLSICMIVSFCYYVNTFLFYLRKNQSGSSFFPLRRHTLKEIIAQKKAPSFSEGAAIHLSVIFFFMYNELYASYFLSAGTSLMEKLILPILSLPRQITVTLSPRVRTSSTCSILCFAILEI